MSASAKTNRSRMRENTLYRCQRNLRRVPSRFLCALAVRVHDRDPVDFPEYDGIAGSRRRASDPILANPR